MKRIFLLSLLFLFSINNLLKSELIRYSPFIMIISKDGKVGLLIYNCFDAILDGYSLDNDKELLFKMRNNYINEFLNLGYELAFKENVGSIEDGAFLFTDGIKVKNIDEASSLIEKYSEEFVKETEEEGEKRAKEREENRRKSDEYLRMLEEEYRRILEEEGKKE